MSNGSGGTGVNLSVQVFANRDLANLAVARLLSAKLVDPTTRNVLLATGNTPLALYAEVGRRRLDLRAIHVFALDEYVGVPDAEPRNCANVLRTSVIGPWGIARERFHPLPTGPSLAAAGIRAHETDIREAGGLDLVVLGIGLNGHIGFNEPGGGRDSDGRVVRLAPSSITANREWFHGDYAPNQGVTVGMKLILEARTVMLLAFGLAKATAVRAMIESNQDAGCPASFLQTHPNTTVFLDEPAATQLSQQARIALSDSGTPL